MKNTIKTTWNDKRVTVSVYTFYMVGEFGKTLHLKVKMEPTFLLPDTFVKGVTYRVNPDIINTMGGLPRYLKKMLDDTARLEQQRRSVPIAEQLSFDL